MSLKSMDVTHRPFYLEVLMVSAVSTLMVSDFRYLLNYLRSRIGLNLLLVYGTKKSLFKKARDA